MSIDIDVLDLPLIPGCVSAEPNGMTYAELRDTLAAIAEHCDVVGLDLVEVNPTLDVGTGITSYLAAQHRAGVPREHLPPAALGTAPRGPRRGARLTPAGFSARRTSNVPALLSQAPALEASTRGGRRAHAPCAAGRA